jgi:DNA-binding GntR family transcriptional regulator
MGEAFDVDSVVPIDRTNLTLADRVEAQLRAQIVGGMLATGARLNEGEIAQSFGVSRGPVREALQRLAHHGLVTLESHRGAFVRRLDLTEVKELFEVRIALECEAAELAAERIDAEGILELSQMQAHLDSELRNEPRAGMFDNFDLHEVIVVHADNARLAKLVRQVNSELRLARSRSGAGQRAHEAVEEHRQLITCLTSGDRKGAREAMRVHLSAALQNTILLLGDPEHEASLR